MFKNKIQPISLTKFSWLMLFKEISAVYCEIHMKPINTLFGQSAELLVVEVCGTYNYRWTLKG
jgi:hypothetical protein